MDLKPALAIALGVIAGLGVTTLRAQDCAKCAPRPDLGVGIVGPGSVSICFQDPPSSSSITDHQADMKVGFDYWKNQVMPAVGQSLSFSYSTGKEPNNLCSGVDVVIKEGTLPDPSWAAMASPTGGITWAPGALGGFGQGARQVASGHEFGHVLGWDQVTDPDCVGDTIMYEAPTSNFPSGALCGDLVAATAEYIGGNTDDGGYGYEPIEDECWEVYIVTLHFYYDGQQWRYGGETWHFWDIYCGPPPI